MADALFMRWPVEATLPDTAALRQVQTAGAGMALRSMVEAPECALLATRHTADAVRSPDGAVRYSLELLSDTGPASEPFGVIMLVAFDVPPEREAEVARWYDEEHIRLLMRADGWLRARRYRVLDHRGGPRWTSMAFHALRDISVMDSPERAFARSTPWRAELERESWFGQAGRGVFRRLG